MTVVENWIFGKLRATTELEVEFSPPVVQV
jgi:hypothetical protein